MPRQSASAEIKQLRGSTPGRINRAAPKPRYEPPEPPSFILDDERALTYWQDLMAETEQWRTYTKLDSVMLGLYVDALSRADRARELCRRGILTMGSDGQPKRHPAALILKDALTEVVRFGRELGLTPASRQILSVGANSDGTDGERLLD
jgi:P27 family predicted phage terminase small subunit